MNPEKNGENTDSETQISMDDQDAQLGAAKQAAASGQPIQMLECLHKSRALDGLVRRLQSKWQVLASSDIDMAVAKAVDAAYSCLRSGKTVTRFAGFLWIVADRRAFDCARLLHGQMPTDPTVLENIADPSSVLPGHDPDDAEDERNAMIRRAAQIARKLVPKVHFRLYSSFCSVKA